jgi:signal transduction histidine kinase
MGGLGIEPVLLGWGVLALSTFATLLPVWLGITVLLNAERRTWGLWLAGTCLIIAGGFFAAHTAMVDGSLLPFPMNPSLWFIGWSIIVLLPAAWYIVVLWFGGFWENEDGRLRRRHRFLLPLSILLALGAVVGVIPFGEALDVASGWLESLPSSPIVRTPIATVIFPLFLFATIALSLDALRTPPATGNAVVDAARRRARPQLVATTLLLLAVTALASYALVHTAGGPRTTLDQESVRLLQWLDLAIVALIATALLTLGRAIVSYEIFTGKTLPRRGLRRHLRNAVLLAATAGLLVGAAHYAPIDRIIVLLLGGIGTMTFYALVNYRSYRERQRFLEQLRPHSEAVPHAGVDGFDASVSSVRAQFDLLCSNVLECSRALLVTYSPSSPLEADTITYPRGIGTPHRLPTREQIESAGDALSQLLDPDAHDGYLWCIPLWGQAGVDGAILLAEKINGGLYTQEEIEVARSTGEQIAALAANVELARSLIELQRRRITDRVVIDSQTRRILHDEVLPSIHALVLSSATSGLDRESSETLVDIHRRISDILRSIPPGTPRALDELGLVGAIRHTLDTEHRTAFDRTEWSISESAAAAAGTLPREHAEVLFYAAQEALRNAARYARGDRPDRAITLRLTASADTSFTLVVEDDGVGIDASASRSDGTGQGLGLHGTLMTVIGGSLSIDSRALRGTRITMTVPLAGHGADTAQ